MHFSYFCLSLMFISLFCVCLFYGLVPELNVLMMMMIVAS